MKPFKPKREKVSADFPEAGKKRVTAPGSIAVLVCAAVAAVAGAVMFVNYRMTFFTPAGLTSMLMLLFPPVCILLSLPGIFGNGTAGRSKAVTTVSAVLSLLSVAGISVSLIIILKKKTSTGRVTWPGCVLFVFLFVLLVILEKILQNLPDSASGSKALADAASSYMAASRLALTVTAVTGAVKLLGFYDLKNVADIIITAVFAYCVLFLAVSFAVHAIRRELITNPALAVPVPFFGKADLSISGYLEKNAGISMRSLFSLKLIKTLLPFTLCFGLMLLWLSTGLIEIAPYEQGAVYRFGVLKNGFLKPGLNITLPYPFDRVERYETGTVKSLTIGYIGSSDADVVWTESHSGEEFKLLLGDGNQLVSVNLRIEYRISDLDAYLRYSAAPEQLLEAAAYELITSELVSTDLETLLSVDRSEFSEHFSTLLTERLSSVGDISGTASTGLSVLSVVLESIHPPVAVADKYQELISAGIIAEKYRLEAEGYAQRIIAEAEQAETTLIGNALADKYKKIADAEAAVSEFMAGAEADRLYSSTYRNMKYLKALSAAYGGSRLVIVGDGIDSSRIWLGYPRAD